MLTDQQQLTIDLIKLRNERGVPLSNRLIIDRLIKEMRNRELSEARLAQLRKLYDEALKVVSDWQEKHGHS